MANRCHCGDCCQCNPSKTASNISVFSKTLLCPLLSAAQHYHMKEVNSLAVGIGECWVRVLSVIAKWRTGAPTWASWATPAPEKQLVFHTHSHKQRRDRANRRRRGRQNSGQHLEYRWNHDTNIFRMYRLHVLDRCSDVTKRFVNSCCEASVLAFMKQSVYIKT